MYRGSCYPDLVGTYFFTDYCAHELMSARQGITGIAVEEVATQFVHPPNAPQSGFPSTPASLHADSRGELYLTTTTCCGND